MCKGPLVCQAWEDADDECINLLDTLMNEDAWLAESPFQAAPCDPSYSAAMQLGGCSQAVVASGAGGRVLQRQDSRPGHSSASLQSLTHSSPLSNNGHSGSSSCSSDSVIEAMSSELCQQLLPAAAWGPAPTLEPAMQLHMEHELHAALTFSPRSCSFQQQLSSNSCQMCPPAPRGAYLSAPLPTLHQASPPLPKQAGRQALSTASAETAGDVFDCACSALEAKLGGTACSSCGSASSSADGQASSRDLLLLQAMLSSALNAPAAAAAAMASAAAAAGGRSGHGPAAAAAPRASADAMTKLQGSRVNKRSGSLSKLRKQASSNSRQSASNSRLVGATNGSSSSPRQQLERARAAKEEDMHALLVHLLKRKHQEQQMHQLQRRQQAVQVEETLLAALLSL